MLKRLRFLVSLHGRENDFQIAQAECAERTARKLGVETEIVFADDDAVNAAWIFVLKHPLRNNEWSA